MCVTAFYSEFRVMGHLCSALCMVLGIAMYYYYFLNQDSDVWCEPYKPFQLKEK